jgi:hypothetical protein
MTQETNNCSGLTQYKKIILVAARLAFTSAPLLQELTTIYFRLLANPMDLQLPLMQVLLHRERQILEV